MLCSLKEKYRRLTDLQTGRQTNGWIGGRMDRQTDSLSD